MSTPETLSFNQRSQASRTRVETYIANKNGLVISDIPEALGISRNRHLLRRVRTYAGLHGADISIKWTKIDPRIFELICEDILKERDPVGEEHAKFWAQEHPKPLYGYLDIYQASGRKNHMTGKRGEIEEIAKKLGIELHGRLGGFSQDELIAIVARLTPPNPRKTEAMESAYERKRAAALAREKLTIVAEKAWTGYVPHRNRHL